ncbi:5'-methylthioadenosine_nucleosidase / S-adenosylhomocysteine nucleosidase [Hexamita inflata]|uniref:5'-methylthioadenosine_nucleosidase / S-adenosylhomocysteine nucleosidase n=1 Tax=Hexamita inflata TaxID=28002 RepID=A0ABP1HNA6_9EUKA
MKHSILEFTPEAQCGEMEGAAVVQACLQIKMDYCIVRVISDAGDSDARITISFVISCGCRMFWYSEECGRNYVKYVSNSYISYRKYETKVWNYKFKQQCLVTDANIYNQYKTGAV